MSTVDTPIFDFVRLPMGRLDLELQGIPLNPPTRGTVTHEVDEVVFREPDADGNQTCTMIAAPMSESYTITLPPNDGDPGQVLETDGDGTTVWTNPTGGVNGVESDLVLSNDGFISVSDPASGDRHIRESAAVMSSGNMSGINGLDVSGTGQIVLDTSFAASNAIRLNASAGGVDIDATGPITIDSSGGAITIGGEDVVENINIGTGGANRQIVIGNSDTATFVQINAGTAGIDIGTNAIAHAVTIGNGLGGSSVALNAGTGGVGVGSNSISHLITIGNTTGATRIEMDIGGTGSITMNNVVIDAADDMTDIHDLANTAGGTFEMFGSGSGSVTIQTAAAAGSTTFQLPNTDGTGGQVLETDGSGITSWVDGGTSSDEVQADAALANDGFVTVSDPGNGTRNIRESAATMTSGAMSGLTGLDVSGGGQVTLTSSLTGTQAIEIQATGTTSGIDIDATGLINIDSSIANTQAVTIIASNSAGGVKLASGTGGHDVESNGPIDIQTLVNTTQAIQLRATGTNASIEFDSGTGGVRIVDGGVGLFIEDSGSNFAQQLAVPSFAGDIKWTLPSSQGANNTRLENNGSGVLSWVAPAAGTSPDSTGVLTGGLLTVNADTTKFDVEDGTGLIYNPSTQIKTEVSWSGLTAQDNGGWTGILTYVSINSGGTVTYNTSKVTNAQTRSQIFLGVLVHIDAVNIDVTNDEQCVLVNYVNSIRDLSEALGFVNASGNTMSAAASDLTILKSAGTMFKFGANWLSAEDNPHLVSLPVVDTSGAGEFQYRMQDGTSSALTLTDIIPNIKDDNTNYPGTTYAANRFGTCRIYTFIAGALKIQPPQFDYNNMADALAAISTEAFVTEPSILENGMLIGFLITQGNTSDLTDDADALFIGAGKLGSVSSTGGSGGDASTDISTSTLNRAAVFADTSGKLLTQDANVVINAGAISGVASVAIDGSSSGTLTLSVPAVAGTTTFTLPPNNGTADFVLRSDGAGITTWVTPGLPLAYIAGYQVFYTSASSITVGVSAVESVTRDSDNSVDISITGSTAVSLASSGLNGLSVDYSETVHTSYEIFVVHDTTGSGLADGYLLIESGDDITTTTEFATNADWDTFRRVGWFRNGLNSDASDIIPFIMQGFGISRVFHYNPADRQDCQVLNVGASATFTEMIDTRPTGGDGDRRTSNMTAPGSNSINLRTAFGDSDGITAANATVSFRPSGNTSTGISDTLWTSSPGAEMPSGTFADAFIKTPLPSNRIIEYEVSDASDELFVFINSFGFDLN